MNNNQHITISIIDSQWPQLQLIVEYPNGAKKSYAQYDVAASQFEPAVKDALRLAVDHIISKHKGAR